MKLDIVSKVRLVCVIVGVSSANVSQVCMCGWVCQSTHACGNGCVKCECAIQ